MAAKNKLQKSPPSQDTVTASPSPSVPANAFILPPPPIATLHPRTYTSFTSREVRAEIRSEERVKGIENDEFEFEDEDEDTEKLPPLERLKRRRELRKELKNAKHFHPPTKDGSPLYFDRMAKAKNKKYDQIRRALEDKKEAAEMRRVQYHASKFAPDDGNKEKEEEYTSKRSKPNTTPKLNKTGKITESTTDSPQEKKFFGNSLRNPKKEKLNKTGKIAEGTPDSAPTEKKFISNSLRNSNTQKINKTGKITPEDTASEEPTSNKPKHLLGVLKKYNSLQFKSASKLNKTGKIEQDEKEDTPKKAFQKPLHRYSNSLRYPAKEKLNKTGKIVETEGEGEGDGEDRITYTTRPKPPPKLNKTGKISNNDEERTVRLFKKEKPNKTGRIQYDPSTPSPSPPSPSSSLPSSLSSLDSNNTPKEKFSLREHLTRLQASSLSSSSSSPVGLGAASAALHVPSVCLL